MTTPPRDWKIPPPPDRPVFKAISEFSDEEIAREYHWRMMKKLGDPRVGVGSDQFRQDPDTSALRVPK